MDKLPRVCVVSPLYHPHLGGVGRQAVALTEKLHAAGVRLFVICRNIPGLPDWEPAQDIEVRRLPAFGSRKHDLEEKTLGNMLISLSFCLNLLLALFRYRNEYDLVHFHGASLPLIFSVMPLKLMRKKIVAKVAGAKMKIEAGSFRGAYLFLGDIFIRILRRVDAFVAISSEIRDDLLKDGFDPAVIHEIPNFILPGQFHPLHDPDARERLKKGLGIDSADRALTFSGRLVKRKRVDVLLGAMAEVLRRRSDVVLIVLGQGEMKAGLENMARSLGIQDRVVFRNFVPNILDYLHITDIFVFPSGKEGLPNALLEAMACSLPVIASRIGGVTDIVKDRENGLLVAPGDQQELGKAILELLDDELLRRNLAANAAETIRSGYGIESIAPRYLDLYRKAAYEV